MHQPRLLSIYDFVPYPPVGLQLIKPLTPVTKVAYGCTDQGFTVSRDTLHDHGKG